MGKKETDRLNGDLKRLKNIQEVLLSAHAGKVPDNYVNILVEEIRYLWKAGERNQKSDSKPLRIGDPKDYQDHKGWRATSKDIPKVKLDEKPEGWDG